ncbi:MAG: aminotransferase class I/II-fold pyridoxal phosphate-dependent enzyme [Methanocellales archaeon]|nr:aminotransferase class I/II-fold pyridoxal phosphate-dependent enzyme [Methanocellales archaeon]
MRVRKEVLELGQCIHGGSAPEVIGTSGKMIDFSINVNPVGHPDIREILLCAYENVHRYPDNQYLKFRGAAASFTGVNRENIVPGNGSVEIIRLFAELILESGDKVIITYPTFCEYEFNCRFFGAKPLFVEHSKLDTISDEMLEESKILFLCNPNNPTGELVRRSSLEELAHRCVKNQTYLFVDETFIELSDPEQSIVNIAAKEDFIFVLRSLTKCFSVPGIRIGYGIGSRSLIELMNKSRLSWNLSCFAEEVGVYHFQESNYLEESRELIKSERKWLISKLSEIGVVRPLESDANFILLDITGTGFSSSELTECMLYHGFLIRNCSSFKSLGEDYVRVAVRTRKDNEKLVAALKQVIDPNSRASCEHYPCHFMGQDCTFCFCPFYPCNDDRLGKNVKKSSGGFAWSCINCDIIHQKDIVQDILEGLLASDELSKVWKNIEMRL